MTRATPEIPEAAIDLGHGAWVAEGDVTWQFSRSGGPGGQNVNKVATKASLRVPMDAIQGINNEKRARIAKAAGGRLTRNNEILIQSESARSQRRNRDLCVERLTELVTDALRPRTPRIRTRRSRASIERRLERKRQKSEKKRRRKWHPGNP